jgi:hypothetical protein
MTDGASMQRESHHSRSKRNYTASDTLLAYGCFSATPYRKSIIVNGPLKGVSCVTIIYQLSLIPGDKIADIVEITNRAFT